MKHDFVTYLIVPLCSSLLAACVVADPGDTDDGDNPADDVISIDEPVVLPDEVTAALDLPTTPDDYAGQILPAHFQTPAVQQKDNTPGDNPIVNETARLGRVLFYDVSLSQNRTVACASCHRQDLAFTDDARLSEGFDGGVTGRNSMSLVNVRFYRPGRMFWDERAATLEDQVLMPIQDPVEMGLTLDELIARVEGQPYYGFLFEEAFGDPSVSTDRISRALAQFVRSLVSHRSRFDEGLLATGDMRAPFPNFTDEENRGKGIFTGPGRCATCHLENGGGGPGGPGGPGGGLANQAIFQLERAVNNGLDAGPVEDDNGVGDVIDNPNANGVFKSPSLRNVALTGPYMHDGRFETLAQVIGFYNNGVRPHPNLDPRLRGRNGQPRRLNLDPGERAALEAFLRTLTDDSFLTEAMYADPFRP